MSGFIATGTTPHEVEIDSDGFWPLVSPSAMREAMRLDGSIAPARLREALVAAVSTINDELAAWQGAQRAAGVGTLADVPAPQVDGTSRLVRLYLRAVACCAAADIAEQYRSFDATSSGNERADTLAPSIDELRRNQRWALRDFLGLGRVTVELI